MEMGVCRYTCVANLPYRIALQNVVPQGWHTDTVHMRIQGVIDISIRAERLDYDYVAVCRIIARIKYQTLRSSRNRSPVQRSKIYSTMKLWIPV